MTDSTILRVVMVVWIRFAASITGSWPVVALGVAASASTTASPKHAARDGSEGLAVASERRRRPSFWSSTSGDPLSGGVISFGMGHPPFHLGGATLRRLQRARVHAATLRAKSTRGWP